MTFSETRDKLNKYKCAFTFPWMSITVAFVLFQYLLHRIKHKTSIICQTLIVATSYMSWRPLETERKHFYMVLDKKNAWYFHKCRIFRWYFTVSCISIIDHWTYHLTNADFPIVQLHSRPKNPYMHLEIITSHVLSQKILKINILHVEIIPVITTHRSLNRFWMYCQKLSQSFEIEQKCSPFAVIHQIIHQLGIQSRSNGFRDGNAVNSRNRFRR